MKGSSTEANRGGRSSPMSIDLAGELEASLAQYGHVGGLLEHVRNACGGETGASLEGQIQVLAYLLRQTDEVFSVYALTEASFVVAEMTRSGETLAVWVDSTRIARIAEVVAQGERVLSVELDADIRRIETRGQEASESREGGSFSESRLEGRLVPAAYELRGPVEERELSWFAMQLRRQAR